MASQERRPWQAKLVLAGLSALLALTGAEVVLRLVAPEKVELAGLYSRDEAVGVGLTPGFRGSMKTGEFEYRVAINDLGMRDGLVGPKVPGTRRILMLGDSFVFGVGVALADSLPKALGQRLQSGSKAPVEVLNAGVPGYSPFQELHTLRRLAPVVEPDLVVLVFFVGDDWYGNRRRVAPEEARRGFEPWLARHSVLYRSFDRFVLARLKGRDHYEIHRLDPPPEFIKQMEEAMELLEAMRAEAGARGAAFLVALCPRFTQVYPEAWSKAALVYRLSAEEYTPLEPNRRFGERLAAAGFWYLDLLEPLRQEGERRLLHFPVDGHMNRDGNHYAAGLLARTIEPRLAVGSAPPPPPATGPAGSPGVPVLDAGRAAEAAPAARN